LYWKRAIKESIKSVWSQKARSFLTSLGIIIGAATVILVIDFGEGAKLDIAKQFSNLSVTTIFVNAPANSEGTESKLSYEDADAIKKKAEYIDLVAPVISGKAPVTAQNTTEQINIVGTSVDFRGLSNLSFSQGDFFSEDQEKNKKKVVVIGALAAETIFGSTSPDVVGQTLTINKKSYEIIGIIAEKGGSFGPLTIDDSIFMPFTVAERYALSAGGKMTLNVSARDLASIDLAMAELSVILRDEHNISASGVDDFKLKDMGSNVVAAKESAQTMAILLSSVAAIVLVVGGIGIMNVMYINVTERTREIGLRKALGAKKKQIMLQFITEALIISLFGSLVGLLLGMGLYPLALSLGAKVVHVWWGVFVAIGFAISIGVFFGYYPAKKAANLDPIEALRYE
jgi:putative ABC transport system permease protein